MTVELLQHTITLHTHTAYAVVTGEIKNYFEIISKLFRCFISSVTMSETEIKLFQLLKEF